MKQTLFLLSFLLSFSTVFSQGNQWTWMNGDSLTNQRSIYGTKGTPSSLSVPGARNVAVGWTDLSGNLWLFGGNGYTANSLATLNDLWKYTISTGQWTWVNGDSTAYQQGIYGTKGVASSLNKPGARNTAMSWTDASGKLWLFGGSGYPAADMGFLNDFWAYDPSNGQWTWVSGDSTINEPGIYGTRGLPSSTNKPGARRHAVTWSDASGNLWLFGGYSFTYGASGPINDLWKYTPATNQWTWLSADSTPAKPGIYGKMGVEEAINIPGPREGAVSWTDASGNLWLFGGDGSAASNSTSGSLNDLWKYTLSTGRWTWIGGDSTVGQPGVYGVKGVAASANKPEARTNAVSWSDALGNLWLYGGNHYTGFQSRLLNDLWKFSVSSGKWTWMGGDSTSRERGVYGSRGLASSQNKPGAKLDAVTWSDAAGNFWLFGGYTFASSGFGYINDLWKYSAAESVLPVQFSRFAAQKQQLTVLLNWTTMQEQNSRYFMIERSSLGTVYDSIGNVRAAGNMSSATIYSFTDNAPMQGTNFYRLMQVDKDGRFTYSAVIRIVMEKDAARFNVIKNPVQNTLQLNVQLPDARKLLLQVRDLSGHLLINEERLGVSGNSKYTLPVEHLARGTYFINLQSGNVSSTKTFVKQ